MLKFETNLNCYKMIQFEKNNKTNESILNPPKKLREFLNHNKDKKDIIFFNALFSSLIFGTYKIYMLDESSFYENDKTSKIDAVLSVDKRFKFLIIKTDENESNFESSKFKIGMYDLITTEIQYSVMTKMFDDQLLILY
jgi:hypothetical protein